MVYTKDSSKIKEDDTTNLKIHLWPTKLLISTASREQNELYFAQTKESHTLIPY